MRLERGHVGQAGAFQPPGVDRLGVAVEGEHVDEQEPV
jgi:hypothetical protein